MKKKDEVPTDEWSSERLTTFVEVTARRAGQDAWRGGRALIIMRPRVPDGEWLAWLRAHFGAALRTAYRWMRLAEAIPDAAALEGTSLMEAYEAAGVVPRKAKAKDGAGEASRVASKPPPPPQQDVASLVPALADAVDRCLSVPKKARWGGVDAARLAQEVDRLIASLQRIRTSLPRVAGSRVTPELVT
jgi:hypothetical protein